MERSCYRCGASFEEQEPFCPSCGAAQVKVTTEQLSSAPTSAPAQRKSLLPVVLPLAFPVALICVISPLIGWLALVGMVVLAVFRHQRRFGEMSAGIGARIGVLMGFFTFAIYLLVRGLAAVLSLLPFLSREEALKQIQQTIDRTPDPRVQEMLRWFSSSQGLIVLVVFSLLLLFIIFLVSATVTGAVTGSLAASRSRQQ